MSKHTRFMGFLFGFSVLLLMAAQILIYRQYAFEATWLIARQATMTITQREYRKLGAICNSLQKTQCGIRTFKNILAENPNDRVALSNVAMNLTTAKRYDEALAYYRAYFAAGGAASDVMQWYDFTMQTIQADELPLGSEEPRRPANVDKKSWGGPVR